jgi:hypothetical protein
MSARTLFAAVLVFQAAMTVASAQSPSQIDIAAWKSYRDTAMGFETRYPNTWHVRSATGTGPETVSLDETPQVGKPRRAVQFWVQRQANPQGVSIEQWYGDQLRRMNAASPPMTITSIGGRPTVRRDVVGTQGRHFSFYTSLNKSDIFQITVTQPTSETQLDETYQRLLSTLRFIH